MPGSKDSGSYKVTKKTTPHLVFLTENGMSKHRDAGKDGLPSINSSTDKKRHITAPHDAAYIRRLGFLREELFTQENENLNHALERFRAENFIRDQAAKRLVSRNGRSKSFTSQETFPERFKRLQQQRKEELERHRKGSSDLASKIEPLKGEKLVDVKADDEDDSLHESGSSEDSTYEVQNVVALQRARLAQMGSGHVTSRTHHRSSIPNLNRKLSGEQDRILLTEKHEMRRSESFVRQLSIHQKDGRGLYKGSRKTNLLRADADETDITLDSFRFDSLNFGKNSYTSSNGNVEKNYSAPGSTRTIRGKKNWRYERSNTGPNLNVQSPRNNGHNSFKSEKDFDSNALQKVRIVPHAGSNIHANHAANSSILRTTTSLYTPSKEGYVQLKKIPSLSLHRKGQSMKNGTKIAGGETSSTEYSSLDSYNHGNESKFQRSKIDFLQDNSDMFSLHSEEGDIILVNKSNTGLNYNPGSTHGITFEGDDTLPQYPRGTTPSQSNIDLKPHKTLSLVVEMPDIVLNPPTPTPMAFSSVEDLENTKVVSLRKTFRQNELRSKEVSNLLEDVKELSQVTDTLISEKANGSEPQEVME